SRAPPATGSTARRKDAPSSAANPCARSKIPLVVAAALFAPFPCAHSTNQGCGSHKDGFTSPKLPRLICREVGSSVPQFAVLINVAASAGARNFCVPLFLALGRASCAQLHN